MIYKGWRIIAYINMPRLFEVKNIKQNGHIDYGKEIYWQPSLRPRDYTATQFLADKGDETLSSFSVKGLKRLIDKL